MSSAALHRQQFLSNPGPAQAHAYLDTLAPSTIRLGLDRLSRALSQLGDPHRAVPTIHVAGTNGKGSTCAFISHALSQKYRVGLYTSPHLERANERIRVNFAEIDDDTLARRLREVLERLPDDHELTYFEFGTLLAWWHFAHAPIDLVILETGLGGRLDATNLCEPLVAAITAIDFDHMEFLGHTLPLIAAEKAGIAKPGVPLVVMQQPAEVMPVFEARARELKCALRVEGRDFSLPADWALGLAGPHQRHNAAVAVEVLQQLATRGFALSTEQIRTGLAQTRWPGRLERFSGNPPVLLDGAHNPAGVQVLREALATLGPAQVHLVFGVFGDKDFRPMMKALLPTCAAVYLTPVNSPRSWQPRAFEAFARTLTPCVSAHDSLEEALTAAEAASTHPDALILVAGSLSLVGHARGWLRSRGRSPMR